MSELMASVPVELLRDARGVIEGLHYTTKSLRSISDRLCSAIADAEDRAEDERDGEVKTAIKTIAEAIRSTSVTAANAQEHRERTLRQVHDIAAGALGEYAAYLEMRKVRGDVVNALASLRIASARIGDDPIVAGNYVGQARILLDAARRRLPHEDDTAADAHEARLGPAVVHEPIIPSGHYERRPEDGAGI